MTTTTLAAAVPGNAGPQSSLVASEGGRVGKGFGEDQHDDDDDASSLVVAGLLGGATVGLFSAIGVFVYFKMCNKKAPAPIDLNNTFSGVVQESESEGTGNMVVVGRPVAGVAPPAGEASGPGGPEKAAPGKGETDV